MDASNYSNILTLKSGTTTAQVEMMRRFDPQGTSEDVPDPYYGGLNGFEDVFSILERSSEELLNQLTPHILTE
jgi:protein-tyrosine phosphatase